MYVLLYVIHVQNAWRKEFNSFHVEWSTVPLIFGIPLLKQSQFRQSLSSYLAKSYWDSIDSITYLSNEFSQELIYLFSLTNLCEYEYSTDNWNYFTFEIN